MTSKKQCDTSSQKGLGAGDSKRRRRSVLNAVPKPGTGMTNSQTFGSGVHVYITLPGQTTPVLAGRFVLDATTTGDATQHAHIGRFVYGRSYLARSDAVEFDPVELKLSDKIYETGRLRGVFCLSWLFL
ncbi:MAG: hypothetical protein LBF66_03140 [Holosporales bacterium]|jgi:hypothetical protein|nr:hypothetical protein [Holosporales bacterium]